MASRRNEPDYSDLCLPYTGVSAHQKYQMTLNERQLKMIEKLYSMCREFGGAGEEINSHQPIMARRAKPRFPSKTVDSDLNNELKISHDRYLTNPSSQKMVEFRQTLPAHHFKDQILSHVRNNQVFVISGETGCGKTTQVPQFILEEAIQSGNGSSVSIVCTQPRRVAAITVAERVAQERGEMLGSSVGYQVRMDSKTPRDKGSIMYCTSGILLQRMQSDRQIRQFTHIILDEVHERDVMTDIIMVILKEVLEARPDIRIILMSATLNGAQFSKFYGNCPVLHIPGFMYPVTPFYLGDVLQYIGHEVAQSEGGRGDDNYYQNLNNLLGELKLEGGGGGEMLKHSLLEELNLDLVASLICRIASEEGPGGILVFLPGWEDICQLTRILESLPELNTNTVTILPLHGSMSPSDQKLIFRKAMPGCRKVVIATNIAESSVTIDDIVFVIDGGRAKVKMFDPIRNLATLRSEWVSRANAKQRAGRAGRTQPGKVYKMLTREREEGLPEYMAPEMLRTRLENVILKIKVLEYNDVWSFLQRLMDAPSSAAVELAAASLKDIGAVDHQQRLTPLGRTLAALAVDPQLGKMMVMSCAFSCLDPVLSVVTSLDYKSPFHVTSQVKEASKARDLLAAGTMSDHLAVANAVAAWSTATAQGKRGVAGCETRAYTFCSEFFLSSRVLASMQKMKYQYALELYRLGLLTTKDPIDPESNRNSGVEAVVRSVITIGLVPNIGVIQERDGAYQLMTCRQQIMEFHPRSTNRDILTKMANCLRASIMPRWFAYYENMQHTAETSLHDSTATGSLALLLLAANITLTGMAEPHTDTTIDVASREKLGVTFQNDNVEVVDVRVTAGDRDLRLYVVEKGVADKILTIRSVLNNILQAKYLGEGKGVWDTDSPPGTILALFTRILACDKYDV